jgi:hypothetical protein
MYRTEASTDRSMIGGLFINKKMGCVEKINEQNHQKHQK